MQHQERYDIYAGSPVRAVPIGEVKALVNAFMDDAALNMSNKYEDTELERVIYLIINDFPDMPIAYIRSALYRGSLGKFGAGRLIPKVVFGWLTEVQNEYTRDKVHKDREEYLKTPTNPINIYKQPVGQAILKKIDWLLSGKITSEDYDRIDVFVLAQMIAQNRIDLSVFLIDSNIEENDTTDDLGSPEEGYNREEEEKSCGCSPRKSCQTRKTDGQDGSDDALWKTIYDGPDQ